jgi:hypothetical protein
MNGWDAFLVGLSCARDYRRLLLVLFVVNMVVAAVMACPAAWILVEPAKRPAIQEASDGLDAWFIVEAFLQPDVGEGPQAGGVEAAPSQAWRRIGLVGVVTVGILLVLAWLSKAFLSGGVLSTYSKDDGFSWRRFVRGSLRWFGTFLLLGPAEAAATVLASFLLLVLAVIGFAAGGGWLGWIVVPVFGGAGLLWWATMEMAYVVAVVDERRNVFGVLRRAAGFVLGHPLAVGALYGAAIVIWSLVTVLYRWGLRPRITPGGWLILFSLHQVFIVVRLFLRLARLAGGMRLYQARGRSGVA